MADKGLTWEVTLGGVHLKKNLPPKVLMLPSGWNRRGAGTSQGLQLSLLNSRHDSEGRKTQSSA